MGRTAYLNALSTKHERLGGPEFSAPNAVPIFWLAMFELEDLSSAPLVARFPHQAADSDSAVNAPYLTVATDTAISRLERRRPGLDRLTQTLAHRDGNARRVFALFANCVNLLRPSVVVRLDDLAGGAAEGQFAKNLAEAFEEVASLDLPGATIAVRSKSPMAEIARLGHLAKNGDPLALIAGATVAELEWSLASAGKHEGDFKPYLPSTTFELGDLVRHPRFGNGVVRNVDGTKIEVYFAKEAEPRKMAHGMRA